MANERRLSIFNDRGSIGSETDLDEYGVWVKSETEEFPVPEKDDSFGVDFPPFDEGDGSAGKTAAPAGRIKTEPASQAGADVTLSAALLLKIAEELALIKTELTSLRSELNRIRGEKTEPVAGAVSAGTGMPENKAGDDLPIEAAEDEVVDDAVFDDFGIEEAADEAPAYDETAESGFFDADEDSDKIALTSDELDLLSESADETPEEMEDAFFAGDSDDEKIAFTGDEITNMLDGTKILDEEAGGDAEGPEEAAEEPETTDVTAVDDGDVKTDTDEKEAAEPEAAREEPLIEDDAFDINIETAEEPLSEDSPLTEDVEIALDEEPLDIEIADESLETADIADDLNIETDADTDVDENEAVPETTDIAFDPFGSFPDEDILTEDKAVTEKSAASLEEDIRADFSAGEESSVEDADTFAEFPVAGESLAEEESAKTAEDDFLADLPPLEDAEFNESITTDETKTEEKVLPDETFDETEEKEAFVEETAETVETPETLPLPDETFDPEEVVKADPELSRLLDEDIRPLSPALDDTSYLDDEKPLEFDETDEPETPALPDEPAAPEELLPEAALSEAIVPFPEKKPDAPETAPSGEESPVLKGVSPEFKQELRAVLSYMDILLESLPEEKIEEFARSEHFEPYKKLFKELDLV
jgi:hypothetical protein